MFLLVLNPVQGLRFKTMQKESTGYGEWGGLGGGGLGMNFKYLWPNLQEIDQALPS